MKTLEVVGEPNLQRICKEQALTSEEVAIVRQIFAEWDATLSIRDSVARLRAKIAITEKHGANLNPASMVRVAKALAHVSSLFVTLR